MVFYKVHLHGLPRVLFAHTTRSAHYVITISPRERVMELGLHSDGTLAVAGEAGDYEKPDRSVSVYMPDTHLTQQATTEDPLYLSCVAVEGDFTYERLDTGLVGDAAVFLEQNTDCLLLPDHLPLGVDYTEADRLLRLLILQCLQDTVEARLRAAALFVELITLVSELFRRTLAEPAPFRSGAYYARKARLYIDEHYAEALQVTELAALLHITPNYLSRVFKDSTGQTLTTYLTLVRLEKARRLAYDTALSFEDIAQAVGIGSVAYLNRLFRKHYGTGLATCRLTDREISLYHAKPW